METLMTVELYRTLSEKQRRLYLGQMALLMGRGGIAHLRRFYGASRDTISKGIKEVQNGVRYDPREGERRSGGGRHSISEVYQRDVDQLVVDIAEGSSYGSPTDERTWTTMSCAKIAEILAEKHGINTTSQTVSNILRRNKLSRQQNQKMRQNGPQDPERDKQFRYIEELPV